jgi:putative transcriptional regulator
MNPKTGNILISEPFLLDPNFKRSVVLLTEHNDLGTVGFVLNQPTDLTLQKVFDDVGGESIGLYQGGPVELNSLHYIHSNKEIRDSIKVAEGVFWGGDIEEVKQGLQLGTFDADSFRFFVGYSGWAPGQLQAELEEGSWMVSEMSSTEIFGKDEALWKTAVKKLGGDDSLLANSPTDPHLN